MQPVYAHFMNAVALNDRITVNNALVLKNGRYEINFEELEALCADENNKMLILCSPHNPVGRVWTKEELQQVAAICKRQNVLVIADEIHADLTLPGHRHTSFSTVSEDAFHNSITFIAPSKTFNMAGLASSVCYVPDIDVRRKFFAFLDANELSLGTLFAYIAADAAFSHGEQWLHELLAYLQGNIDFTEQYLKDMPQIKMMRPQASFLLWLDFRELGLAHNDLVDKLIHKAKVGLNSGLDFGPEGEGFMRMNIGTPQAIVKEALERIKSTLVI